MYQSQDPAFSHPEYIIHALPQIKLLADRKTISDVRRGTDECGNPTATLEEWSARKRQSRTVRDFDKAGEDGLWLLQTGVRGGDYPK